MQNIRDKGVSRKQIGIVIDGARLAGPNTTFWSIKLIAEVVGKVTSAVYSPRLEKNIALCMVDLAAAELGTELSVDTPAGTRHAIVVEKPFYDPKKQIATGKI